MSNQGEPPRLWISQTEALPRLQKTDALPHMVTSVSVADKLPATDLAESVIADLWYAIVTYNLRHPRMLASAMSKAAMHMRQVARNHNLAEESTYLTIAVGELGKDPAIALHPLVRPALEQAQRFLRYATTPGH